MLRGVPSPASSSRCSSSARRGIAQLRAGHRAPGGPVGRACCFGGGRTVACADGPCGGSERQLDFGFPRRGAKGATPSWRPCLRAISGLVAALLMHRNSRRRQAIKKHARKMGGSAYLPRPAGGAAGRIGNEDCQVGRPGPCAAWRQHRVLRPDDPDRHLCAPCCGFPDFPGVRMTPLALHRVAIR